MRSADGVVEFGWDGKDRLSETRIPGEGRVMLDVYAAPLGRLSRFAGAVGEALTPEVDWIYAAGQLVATVRH
ncbi:MAG TPA: hypothetical protein ENJ18_15180, partial [Nannocystis exedens]|nr:hypothetical protein [Nannocystis exedens]